MKYTVVTYIRADAEDPERMDLADANADLEQRELMNPEDIHKIEVFCSHCDHDVTNDVFYAANICSNCGEKLND